MKRVTLVIGVCLVLLSGCDFSGCKGVVAEEQALFQEWDQLRKEELSKYREELKDYNERKFEWQSANTKEIRKCMLSPRSSYEKAGSMKGPVDFYGGYNAYVRKFGVKALCDSIITGLGFPESPPQDNSLSYPPAVAKYVLSKRVIVNNPKCFSATDVATAQGEIVRLAGE